MSKFPKKKKIQSTSDTNFKLKTTQGCLSPILFFELQKSYEVLNNEIKISKHESD